MQNHHSGFTLIEILVVLSITIMIIAFVPIIFSGRQELTKLDMATSEMLSVLRQAQSQSVARKASSSWGVYFDSNEASTYTLYAGQNYLDRDVLHDRKFDLGDGITWSISSATDDINFSGVNGFSNATATIAVSHSSLPDNKTIDINEVGKIERN